MLPSISYAQHAYRVHMLGQIAAYYHNCVINTNKKITYTNELLHVF